jgi:hypothetical protein
MCFLAYRKKIEDSPQPFRLVTYCYDFLKSGQEQFLLNKFPAKSPESAKSAYFNRKRDTPKYRLNVLGKRHTGAGVVFSHDHGYNGF